MTRSCARPSPSQLEPADDRGRHAVGLADHELGRAGDLVRDRDRASSAARSRRGRAARAGRAAPCSPAAPIATSVVPCRHGRPNESVTSTPTVRPVSSRRRSRRRAADASGSSGSSTSVPAPGRVRRVHAGRRADEPVPRLARSRAARARARSRTASRRIASTWRGSLVLAGELARRARPARARRGGRRGPRPWTRPSGPRPRRRRPRARRARRSARRGRRPRATSGHPRDGDHPELGHGEAGEADAGVRLVAPVDVHDHRGQPLQRLRAGERAGVDGAAGDELPGELEREPLRVLVVAADERVLVGRLVPAEVRRPRASGGRRRPARDRRVGDPLGERARVGRRA